MATYVVTGGGGFVGSALCRALRAAGHDVVAVARGEYPELSRLGVRAVRCDIGAGGDALEDACRGADGIFHVAAKVAMWGPYPEFHRTNVLGTRHLIEAARRAGVRHFVFTSSPSVIASGKDLEGVNESIPYPEHYHAHYPMTKAQAEREVLAAHGDTLRTVSLRPHLITGPGDTTLIPLILKKARAGRLVRIGSGRNLVDLCHIDSCVDAHLRAMEELMGEGRCGGKAYFVSQGSPLPLWSWIDAVLDSHGLPPVRRSVPPRVAVLLGQALEVVARLVPAFEPPFTRFLAEEMATHHYFDISAAARDFGFKPLDRSLEPRTFL